MKTIVGLFEQSEDAAQMAVDLERAGFAPQSINVLRSVRAMWHALGCAPGKVVAKDFGIGAALGVALYALFGVTVALGEIMVGFDRVIALQALVVFVVLGIYVGGLLGVFFGMADSEQQSRSYLAGIRRGGALVTVRTADEHSARAMRLLQEAGAKDVHICLRDRHAQESLEHAYEEQDRLFVWLRRIGRGVGLALVVLVLSLFIGEGLDAGGLPDLLAWSVTEDFLLLALLMTIIGVLIAMRWEGLGGLVIVGSVLLFEGINAVVSGYWRFGIVNALFLVVGTLFLYLWWRRESHMPHERALAHA